MSVRVAVVGCGTVARMTHLPGLRAGGDADVAVFTSRRLDRAAALRDEWGSGELSADWRAVVARPDVDAVHVCLPNALHAEVAAAALRAGKHVLVEKPITTTLADADQLLALAESAGVLLGVAFDMRCHPLLAELRRRLPTIGTVRSVQVSFGHGGPQEWAPDATWFRDPGLAGGGCLMDLGGHVLDLLRYAVGPVTEVRSAALVGPIDEDASLRLTVAGRTDARVDLSWHAEPHLRLSVLGSTGELSVTDDGVLCHDGVPVDVPPRELTTAAGDFARAVATGGQPAATGTERPGRAGGDARGVRRRAHRAAGGGPLTLRAGVGVADITPTEPVRLAGFMARQPAVPPLVVNDRLDVRALALDDGEVVALLLVLDLVGLSAAFSAPVRVAVSEATGVPVERVLTSATHTHSGPDTLLGMDLYDGYLPQLCAAASAAAHAALAALVPVSVGVGEVDVPTTLAVNRRGRAHSPRLQLVDLRAGGGAPVASVVGVGIHPVTHGPDVPVVTADWVGHCRRAVERARGGTAVVVSGALGDVNPPGGDGYDRSGGGVELATSVGEAVAALAVDAADRAVDVGDSLDLAHRTVELPVADAQLSRLISGGAETVVAELFEWTVGDLRLVSMPGEPLSGFATAVGRLGPMLTVGLAPTWQGYLPHPDTFDGGYEDDLGLGAPAMRVLLDALSRS